MRGVTLQPLCCQTRKITKNVFENKNKNYCFIVLLLPFLLQRCYICAFYVLPLLSVTNLAILCARGLGATARLDRRLSDVLFTVMQVASLLFTPRQSAASHS